MDKTIEIIIDIVILSGLILYSIWQIVSKKTTKTQKLSIGIVGSFWLVLLIVIILDITS